jgi:phosphorylcholine metabolism protein LicD
MGQSLVQNYMHIIFSTKNRMRYLKSQIQLEIFKYIGSLCNEKKMPGYKSWGF